MSSFFSASCPEGPFVLLSMPHLMAIFIIGFGCILVYILRDTLKKDRINRYFRMGLFLLLIFQEISFQLWNVSTGEWSVNYTLPLQLCSVSAVLSAVMVLRNSYSFYEVIYFWGIGGAVQAVLTPEIGIFTYPHYRYFQFFLCHGGILIACLFMTFVQEHAPRFKSVLKAFLYLNIYGIFIAAFNRVTGSNYLFICSKPEVSSIMDYLGPWPWYLLSLEFVALIIFFILYIPFVARGSITRRGTKDNYINLS